MSKDLDQRTEIDLGEQHMTIIVTSEGIIVDIYDYEEAQLVGTFSKTFTELAEMIMEDN